MGTKLGLYINRSALITSNLFRFSVYPIGGTITNPSINGQYFPNCLQYKRM